VAAARTGQNLSSKVFYGPLPACASTLDYTVANPDDAPPWMIAGPDPSADTIDAWAVTISTQAVE
jgi:hypothetical protein